MSVCISQCTNNFCAVCRHGSPNYPELDELTSPNQYVRYSWDSTFRIEWKKANTFLSLKAPEEAWAMNCIIIAVLTLVIGIHHKGFRFYQRTKYALVNAVTV